MPSLRSRLAAVLLLAIVLPPAHAVDVPTGHPVYPFLDRQELLGRLASPLPGALPLSREQVALRLVELDSSRTDLTAVERGQLDRFIHLFREDVTLQRGSSPVAYRETLTRRDLPFELYANGRDALSLKGDNDDGWELHLNPALHMEVYQRQADSLGADPVTGTVLGWGAAFRLRYDRWSAALSVLDAQVSYSDASGDSSRYPYRTSAPAFTSDDVAFDFYDSYAQIAYETRHIGLWFGTGRQSWAAGRSGSLFLNDRARPYTHLRFTARFKPFQLTFSHGRLHTEPRIITAVDTLAPGEFREHYAEKWMAAQRIEWFYRDWLRVGLFEQVIYGERGLDFDYLNPVSFLVATEQYKDSPDNMLIGGDVRLMLFNRMSLQVAALFDEFVLSSLGSDSYVNKWALQISGALADPLGVANSLFWIDYTRLRPLVYSHTFPINHATHLGANLGYDLPPNSDRIIAGWRQAITPTLRAEVHAGRDRHGANPTGGNAGGDVRVPEKTYTDSPGAMPFLDGLLRDDIYAGLGVDIELLVPLHLRLALDVRRAEQDGESDTDWLGQVMLRWHPYD